MDHFEKIILIVKQKMTTCILQTYIQYSTRQAAKQL